MAKAHGQRIKAARGYAGISTAELATRLGVSESTVKRWEAGDPNLTTGYRVAIAHACDVPIDFIEHGWPSQPADQPNQIDRIETKLNLILKELGYEISTADDESEERLVAGVARAQRALRDANARQTREVPKPAPRRTRLASA